MSPKIKSPGRDRPDTPEAPGEQAPPVDRPKRRTAKKEIGEPTTRQHLTLGQSVWKRVRLAAINRGIAESALVNHVLDVYVPRARIVVDD